MEKERAPGLLGAGSCTQNLIYSIQTHLRNTSQTHRQTQWYTDKHKTKINTDTDKKNTNTQKHAQPQTPPELDQPLIYPTLPQWPLLYPECCEPWFHIQTLMHHTRGPQNSLTVRQLESATLFVSWQLSELWLLLHPISIPHLESQALGPIWEQHVFFLGIISLWISLSSYHASTPLPGPIILPKQQSARARTTNPVCIIVFQDPATIPLSLKTGGEREKQWNIFSNGLPSHFSNKMILHN